MNDKELRSWAIEQAIKHHGGTGVVMETVLVEADKLIAWVNRPEPKDGAPTPEFQKPRTF